MQFHGAEVQLERAIDADDARAVQSALAAGARVNARGAGGVTPLEYAVGTVRARAVVELVRMGADANAKDDDGDTPVTLAVTAYRRDRQLLDLVLAADGDPNTRRPDGDPVIMRFVADHDLHAISYMKTNGADIDAKTRTGLPLVVSAAMVEDWDVVWHLLQLGARFDDLTAANNIVTAFRTPLVTLRGGPQWDAKVKVWRFLKSRGLDPIPPHGLDSGR